MSSQILIKINSIIKNRLIELLGISLILVGIFLLLSIVSYSPSDPNFIYTPENTEIKNIGGFYGSVISDFLLQSLGLISIFLAFNFFYWGLKLTTQKTINNLITKIFFVFVYKCGHSLFAIRMCKAISPSKEFNRKTSIKICISSFIDCNFRHLNTHC